MNLRVLSCRLLALTTLTICSAAFAEEPPASLGNIQVNGRGDDLLGTAGTASEGATGAKELSYRAFARPGEVMETVPGLIITQHDGGGKANQYYLRGFNLDHGTDLATYLDGVPLNLPTHAHGQGYTDTNWLIPELVRTVQFQKGPYFAEYGDFANAGAVEIEYQNTMPRNMAVVEGGNLGYGRALVAASTATPIGNLLYALEYSHFDGAWDVKDDYNRANGVLRLSNGADTGKSGSGYSFSLKGYNGRWDGTEQVPQRAIDSGLIGRYGSLDPTVGGQTHRGSAEAEWHNQTETSQTRANVYFVDYGLDLYSNFSVATDQANGDQIRQNDRRSEVGGAIKHTFTVTDGAFPMEHGLGLQVRHDDLNVSLDHTTRRNFVSAVSDDHVKILNMSPWYQNKTQWSGGFRSVVGGRFDYFDFTDDSQVAANSGKKNASAFSPKASLIFGPYKKTEFYISGGTGIRSVDARSIFITVDPGGGPSSQLPAVYKTVGAEVGVRNNSIEGLKTSLALWTLETESETYFTSDEGTVADSGQKGRRVGIEFNNYYEPNDWITVDADFSVSRARFDHIAPGDAGDHVPEAVDSSIAASVTVHDGPLCEGCFVNLRLRYFGPRDLNSDGSEKSQSSTVLNLAANYPVHKDIALKLEVLNLTDAKYNDAEYYDTSRLQGEAVPPGQTGIDDHLVHPGEPLSVRLGVVAYF